MTRPVLRTGTTLGRILGALLAAGLGCTGVATSLSGSPGPEAGLLRGKTPARAENVGHPLRLTDGITAALNDPPRTDLTAVFETPDAHVVYDLGSETPIRCAALAADGDDDYELALSADGVAFSTLWRIPSSGERGVQPRVARELQGRGRFVRLSAPAGAGVRAVAEVSLAAVCPERWPPVLAPQRGRLVENEARSKAWLCAALAGGYILAFWRRTPDFIKLLVALPVGFAIALTLELAEVWPPPPALRGTLLAALAIVVAAAGLRFALGRMFARRRRRTRPSA